jgi:hypothetical protein
MTDVKADAKHRLTRASIRLSRRNKAFILRTRSLV